MIQVDTDSRHVWSRIAKRLDDPFTRAQLAHMRKGIGKEPGVVPETWPLYTTLADDGRITPQLRAEHVAMGLYAIHQQSRSRSMHVSGGQTLGSAMRGYRQASTGDTPDRDTVANAVDKRLAAIATATTFGELQEHLRRAISLLHREEIPLDYDGLYRDLVAWQSPGRRNAVVRRWGSQYFVSPHSDSTESKSSSQAHPEGGD